jgi:hypothetical protein
LCGGLRVMVEVRGGIRMLVMLVDKQVQQRARTVYAY